MDETGLQRVLVVDDDVNVRDLVCLVLGKQGLEVRSCADGDQAIAAVREELPDLVVLDVMMPGRDGLSVLRELRADPRSSHVPVVLLTALAQDQDVWEGWEAGADYYLTKPFDVQDLVTYVRYLASTPRTLLS